MRTGAILLRVSTKKQAEEGNATYTVQLNQCLEYAARNQIVVPDDLRWQEVGKRDQYFRRDGLQAALTAVEQDRFQALIVWRLDRLTDDIGNFLRILDRLKQHGALPWSATEPDVDLSTKDGLWYVHTKLHFQVAPERRTTATRTQENRREYTTQGRPWASHRARYGYQWIVDPSRIVKRGDAVRYLKEKLEPDPVTGPVMQQIYAWVDVGKTLKWIARALSGLEEGGIYKKPTPRQYQHMAGANEAGEWDEASLTRMLEFPGYMGRWPAYRTKREKRDDGSERSLQKPLNEDEWVWVEPSPVLTPLVSAAQWHRVQTRLANNKLYSERNRANHIGLQFALLQTGMARCGAIHPDGTVCNGPMEAKPRAHSFDYPDGTRVYQYQCRASRRNYPACQGVYTLAEPLDRGVQEAFMALLRHPEMLRRLAQRDMDLDRAEAEGITIITPLHTFEV
jgi:DNA invertase Pin-like site-specific DNA recombinase